MTCLLPLSEEAPPEVALLGGAFDPITLGHELMAKAVFRHTELPVWVMPCYEHRFGKQMANTRHRLTMCKLVSNQHREWMTTFSFEIEHELKGSMYETIRMLRVEYPKTKFRIVVGMDNANQITSWDRGAALINEVPFIVVGRGKFQPVTDWFMKQPHLYIPNDCPVQAREIREAIKNRHLTLAKNMLNPRVWDYIIEHGVYWLEQ